MLASAAALAKNTSGVWVGVSTPSPVLPLGILARPVLQLLHDLSGIVHCLMTGPALYVHHGANAAGVMLEFRAVQPSPLQPLFPSCVSPLSIKTAAVRLPTVAVRPPRLRLYSIVLLSSTSRAVWANFVLLSILFFCK